MKKLIILFLIIGLLIGCSGGGSQDVEEEQGYKFNIYLDKEVLSKIEEHMEETDLSWEFGDWTVTLEKAFWRDNLLLYQLVSKYHGKEEGFAEMMPTFSTEFYENGEVVYVETYGSADSYEDGIWVYNGEANFEDRDWGEDFPFAIGFEYVDYSQAGNPDVEGNIFEDKEGKELPLKNQIEEFPIKKLKVENFSLEDRGYTINIEEIHLDSIYPLAKGTMTAGEEDLYPGVALTNGEESVVLKQLGWPDDEGNITFRFHGIPGMENWEEVQGEILIQTAEELKGNEDYTGNPTPLVTSPME